MAGDVSGVSRCIICFMFMQVDSGCDLDMNFYLLVSVRLLHTLIWFFEVWFTKEHSGRILFPLF